jgi:dethiobiotin synthetase
MLQRLLITGSGTEVGKTVVVTLLIEQLRAAGRRVAALKPLATGFDPAQFDASDAALIVRALGQRSTLASIDAINPWRYPDPVSPDHAAARARRAVDFAGLLAFCAQPRDADITLIEGIGGVMTPLDDRHTVLDWIVALRVPVLLVVGSYLGTLSHSLTAAGMLRGHGVELRGIVVSESARQPVPLAETAATLERFLGQPVVALPRLGARSPAPPDLLPLVECPPA